MLQVNVLFFKDGMIDICKYLFDGILKYLVNKVSKCTVRRSLTIHEIHKTDVDSAVIFQLSQRAVSGCHKSKDHCFQHIDRIISDPAGLVLRDILQIFL